MRSGWFWGTEHWSDYQHVYHHGQVPDQYKSSPLATDEEFDWERSQRLYEAVIHDSVVIDLTVSREELWRGIRKSYHSLINGTKEEYLIDWCAEDEIERYQTIHAEANGGQPRPTETYAMQGQWIRDGLGMLVGADHYASGSCAYAYWILYKDCAYYASGPSLLPNVQHAVIWKSLELLKVRGFHKAEMGDITGETEKEKKIAVFKRGFGGYVNPFTIITRRAP